MERDASASRGGFGEAEASPSVRYLRARAAHCGCLRRPWNIGRRGERALAGPASGTVDAALVASAGDVRCAVEALDDHGAEDDARRGPHDLRDDALFPQLVGVAGQP
jgi:hypothetical protein